ncbi:MAG: hypothetical protein WKF44_03030, partial [Rubrobacteraceae bacterium]
RRSSSSSARAGFWPEATTRREVRVMANNGTFLVINPVTGERTDEITVSCRKDLDRTNDLGRRAM